MAVVAAVLTLGVVLLGIVCFLNFGQGLPKYLKPQDEFDPTLFQRITPSEMEKSSGDFPKEEKVEFPQASVVPIYNVPFGSVDAQRPAPSTAAPAPAPREANGSLRVTIAAPVARPQRPARPYSRETASYYSSEGDPFEYSDRSSVAPLKEQSQSRWSKDTSQRGTTKFVKRWIIE